MAAFHGPWYITDSVWNCGGRNEISIGFFYIKSPINPWRGWFPVSKKKTPEFQNKTKNLPKIRHSCNTNLEILTFNSKKSGIRDLFSWKSGIYNYKGCWKKEQTGIPYSEKKMESSYRETKSLLSGIAHYWKPDWEYQQFHFVHFIGK